MNLDELELNNIADWPPMVRWILTIVFGVLICGAGYWFDVKNQMLRLDASKAKMVELKSVFEEKQHKAVNLEAYKAQMETMKESFGALLRQLPEKTEVPGLVEDISHQGLASGLEFQSIRLQDEEQIDFYVELPMEIAVQGDYHQLAEFVSNVAGLPRIVTLHNFVIQSLAEKGDESEQLLMNITAKTYRYTAESEVIDAPGINSKQGGANVK